MQYTETIVVPAQVSKVFPLFTQHEHMKDWQPSLLGYTLISGQKNAVGSITELTHNMGNKPSIITEEIVEIIPEKKYVTRFTSDGVLNTTTAHFSTTGAGTEITFNSEFHFTGWYKVMVLLKSMFRMETKKTLDNFKKFVTNSVASDVKKK